MQIDSKVVETVVASLRQAYPTEGCGLLLGAMQNTTAVVAKVVMADNESDQGQRRFRIDPLWYQQQEKLADSAGLQILGIVHSHPDCAPIPSETDRAYASYWPGFVWWISRIDQRQLAEHRCWVLDDASERFKEIKWISQ